MPLPRGPDQRAPAALMARTTRWSTKWRAASTRATATRTAGHMYSIRCGDGPANKNVCRYAHMYSIWCGDDSVGNMQPEPANNVCTGLDHPHSSTCNAVTCESKLWRTRGAGYTHTLQVPTGLTYEFLFPTCPLLLAAGSLAVDSADGSAPTDVRQPHRPCSIVPFHGPPSAHCT